MGALDFNVLLDNTESILASAVALLTIITTILLFIGKVKAAGKVKKLGDTLEEHKKEIAEATATIKVIIEGVDKVKGVFRPVVEGKKGVKPNLNAGKIIENYAADVDMKELLNSYVEKFGKK